LRFFFFMPFSIYAEHMSRRTCLVYTCICMDIHLY
jgi:hypothetical protein